MRDITPTTVMCYALGRDCFAFLKIGFSVWEPSRHSQSAHDALRARALCHSASHMAAREAETGNVAIANCERPVKLLLPFWQRLLITIAVTLGAGYLAGLMWNAVFGLELPAYLAGVIGGLAALPTWHFLKRMRPSVH